VAEPIPEVSRARPAAVVTGRRRRWRQIDVRLTQAWLV